MTITEQPRECSFDHDAFIYDSDEGYLTSLVPMLEKAQADGDTVLAVVPCHNAGLLRSALGPNHRHVEFIAAETWYEHPITTIAAYDGILRGLPAGQRAFVIGEVQFGDTEEEWAAWTRYEAALNRVLRHHNARVVCPYDTRALPPSVIDTARRTHEYLVTATDAQRSADYVDVAELFSTLAPSATIPTDAPDLDIVVEDSLQPARRALGDLLADRGLARQRVYELVLAVNEVLTNGLVHGGGRARLRVWSRDVITCVIDDDGGGVNDPLVGYVAPPVGSVGGHGTWLARQMFERSEFVPSPTGGLTVVLATTA